MPSSNPHARRSAQLIWTDARNPLRAATLVKRRFRGRNSSRARRQSQQRCGAWDDPSSRPCRGGRHAQPAYHKETFASRPASRSLPRIRARANPRTSRSQLRISALGDQCAALCRKSCRQREHPAGAAARLAGSRQPYLSMADRRSCSRRLPILWWRTSRRKTLLRSSLRARLSHAGAANLPFAPATRRAATKAVKSLRTATEPQNSPHNQIQSSFREG